MARSDSEITQLLVAWRNGNETAKEQLFAKVYDVLRRLAHKQRAQWRGNATLNTTALVSELYLKLDTHRRLTANDRNHFFTLCSRAMRHILIDYARKVTRKKRGGNKLDITFDESEVSISLERDASDLIDLDKALDRLEEQSPRLCQIVELRYFGGLSCEEIAELRGVTRQTVSRDWTKARTLLRRFLT